ncbi:UNVERIFIED_CONTAM: hypothetical protein Slati_2331600 [Sesamum latifolium]|uniref:Transcription initiation factor IIF subunit beta n=1 Tax=Sesamum latifolium TaxID=2727402 RepID=A0AAW2WB13_9LAMI
MEDDYGNDSTTVDTAKAERSVWLMKCPPVVSKAWQSSAAAAEAPPVAKVVVSLDPLRAEDPSALQFTMEMAGSEVQMPKSYSLNMFKDFVPMCVFSESNQGRVAMEGKVEHKFDMKPHHANIEEYRKCVEKGQINPWSRQDKFRDLIEVSANCWKDKKQAAPVKGSDVKRTRRDRGELEDIMFKLFERQPNWALKQLVQETDQPAQFLKEILNELCVYNKRGTNQGTYELKPEYKKSVEDTGAE